MRNRLVRHPGHDLPTADWIVGRDAVGPTRYVIRTVAPSFLAKISVNDKTGSLAPDSYAMRDGRSLDDFVWFDPTPPLQELRRLLVEADRIILVAESLA